MVSVFVLRRAAATGEPLARCVLLFLAPTGAVERTVAGIGEAARLVHEAVLARLTGSGPSTT